MERLYMRQLVGRLAMMREQGLAGSPQAVDLSAELAAALEAHGLKMPADEQLQMSAFCCDTLLLQQNLLVLQQNVLPLQQSVPAPALPAQAAASMQVADEGQQAMQAIAADPAQLRAQWSLMTDQQKLQMLGTLQRQHPDLWAQTSLEMLDGVLGGNSLPLKKVPGPARCSCFSSGRGCSMLQLVLHSCPAASTNLAALCAHYCIVTVSLPPTHLPTAGTCSHFEWQSSSGRCMP